MPETKIIGGILMAAGALAAAYGGYQQEGMESSVNVLALLLVCAGVFLWRKKPEDSSKD